ncbi:MAG: ADP-ribosylglycohydrolase family protein, partial [Gemmatimonadota bacterium]
LQRLAPTDTLSVVAYDDEVSIVAAPATGAEQPELVNDIRAIRSGGMTNLSGGWLQGRKFVDENARDGAVNRILLLTDGLANRGITDHGKLIGLCREAAGRGVSTTTIGFGKGYDEDLLAAMADAGGGGAYYIEEPDQAPGVFDEELAGLLSIAAQNVTVDVSLSDRVADCRVLHGYPASDENGVLRLQVGDLYAREPRPVLAQFLLKPGDETPAGADDDAAGGDRAAGEETEDAAEIPVGTIVVMGDVLTADGGVEEREIALPIRLSPVEGGKVEPEIRRTMVLLEAAEEREKALKARTEEEYRSSRERLKDVSARLLSIDPDDAELREEAADLNQMVGRLHSGVMESKDIKYMKSRAMHAKRGRRAALGVFSRVPPGQWGEGGAPDGTYALDPAEEEALRQRGLLPEPWWHGDGLWPARDVPSDAELRDRTRGCLLGGAIGDALGRPGEGRRPETIAERYGELRDFHPWEGWTSGPVGTVTDDTQLTMVIARTYVDRGRLDPAEFGRRVADWLDVGRGKGKTCTRAALRLKSGTPWFEAGGESAGNGAAMRAAPVGIVRAGDFAALRHDATLATVPTHADGMAVASTVAQAFAVAYLLRTRHGGLDPEGFLHTVAAALDGIPDPGHPERRPGADPSRRVTLAERIHELPALLGLDREDAMARTYNGGFVLESLPAALWFFAAHAEDPEEAIVRAASAGYDADTVAAMVGNLVGAYHGASPLPARWVEDLEFRDELERLADGLAGLVLQGRAV